MIHNLENLGAVYFFQNENYLELNGRVFEPNIETVWVNSWPETWPVTIRTPINSHVRTRDNFRYCTTVYETTVDTEGDHLEYLTCNTETSRLLWFRMYAREYGSDPCDRPAKELAQFHYHLEGDYAMIDDVYGNLEKIVVPAMIDGHVVSRATLRNPEMQAKTHILIADQDLRELDILSWKFELLEELDIYHTVKLITPPDGINNTPWFHRQPDGQVNLCGYYCGTKGKKAGALKIWHNTIGIISNVDRNANWTSIDIADSVRYIGKYSFSSCKYLEYINLPSQLRKIDAYAFSNCKRLRTLLIPNLCEDITNSFDQCNGLQEVSMPTVCYREDTQAIPFPKCPKIFCRTGNHIQTLLRNVKPDHISGAAAIYPIEQPFQAAGRKYYNLDQLALTPIDEFNFLDSYRQPTWFHCYNSKGFPLAKLYDYGTHNYWFLRGENGLTQVYMREGNDFIIVIEGIDPGDVAEPIRAHAVDYLYAFAE